MLNDLPFGPSLHPLPLISTLNHLVKWRKFIKLRLELNTIIFNAWNTITTRKAFKKKEEDETIITLNFVITWISFTIKIQCTILQYKKIPFNDQTQGINVVLPLFYKYF
jgi:hypothetical protein